MKKKAFKTRLKINTGGKEETNGKKIINKQEINKSRVRSDILKMCQKSGRLQEINSINIGEKHAECDTI